MNYSVKLLLISALLAAGEAIGLLADGASALAPACFALVVLIMLFGYGLSFRFWPYVAVFLLGIALALASNAENEQLYRERPWLRNRKNTIVQNRAYLSPAMFAAKKDLSRRIGIGLEHKRATADLNRAILLGERKQISGDVRDLFIEAGTMHIFAISGLHVMIIASLLVYAMIFAGIPLRFAGAAGLIPLWFYVAIIGTPPSAVRAAIMATFYFSAPLFFRRPDAIVAWTLTFLVVHITNPQRLFDVGNALSFTIMLAILSWIKYMSRFCSARINCVAITLVAWLAGVPIAAHVFGRITPGGIMANLALMPAATISVVTGVLGAAVSFVSETVAAHINNLAALFTEVMYAVSHITVSLTGGSILTDPWSIWECFICYVGVAAPFFLAYLHQTKKRIL